jgi:hypothetical protein
MRAFGVVNRWPVGKQSAHLNLSRASDILVLRRDVCFWQILLQKSFGGDERYFPGPLMRFVRGDSRDHILFCAKATTDHLIGAKDRCRCRSILNSAFARFFGVVRFSTFATISAGTESDVMSAFRGRADLAVGQLESCSKRNPSPQFRPTLRRSSVVHPTTISGSFTDRTPAAECHFDSALYGVDCIWEAEAFPGHIAVAVGHVLVPRSGNPGTLVGKRNGITWLSRFALWGYTSRR